MKSFGGFVTKHRKTILLVGILLLIPATVGYISTGVNYNILTYLPSEIDTVKGEEILMDEFGKGGFAMVMTEGMTDKERNAFTEEIKGIEHVDSVISIDSLTDGSIPTEMLPEEIRKVVSNGDTELSAVFFDTSISDNGSLEALSQIRAAGRKHCFASGMTAFVLDLKNLAETEEPIYIAIAVILSLIVMALFMDSWFIAPVFMVSIAMAIIYNMGSNIIFGEISYITKALSAVLQLAVTMDYSIFLWHSYEEQKDLCKNRDEAMSAAINSTLTSVAGSSIPTIAGFLALCFMSFTLGRDLGLVMAKGVLLGVISSVTVLPALIMASERLIDRTRHRPFMPSFDKLTLLVTRKPAVMLTMFVVILIPALYGYTHTEVYYKLDDGVPANLPFKVANAKLEDDFDMSTMHFALVDSKLSSHDLDEMENRIEKVDGVTYVLSANSLTGGSIPDEILPSELSGELSNDRYQIMLIGSEYAVASDEVGKQCTKLQGIMKDYDSSSMLFGEAPATNDLISITDRDFRIVTGISIIAILLIIVLVLKSLSLPLILVSVIELAIFVNLGIPCYTGTVMSFIDSICISTIQLGATVDYAILMTTRYKKERLSGLTAREAVSVACSMSAPSITVSAMGFFAATFGVSVYSGIDIISSMCGLMCRGAIVSWLSVLLILPAMLMVFDRFIIRTTRDMKGVNLSC